MGVTVGVQPYLFDGYATLIDLSSLGIASSYLFEKETTPAGLDQGGPIDVTTMRNLVNRTRFPKQLLTLDKTTVHCAFASKAYNVWLASIGINTIVNINFPDGATLQYEGWLDKFKPTGMKEGEMPMAEVTIEASNLTIAQLAQWTESTIAYIAGNFTPQ